LHQSAGRTGAWRLAESPGHRRRPCTTSGATSRPGRSSPRRALNSRAAAALECMTLALTGSTSAAKC